jgi:hypothetical protein
MIVVELSRSPLGRRDTFLGFELFRKAEWVRVTQMVGDFADAEVSVF